MTPLFKVLLTFIFFIFLSCSSIDDCLYGTVYVSGNEPFTYLVIDTGDNYYKIDCSNSVKEELWILQGKVINVCDYNINLVEF